MGSVTLIVDEAAKSAGINNPYALAQATGIGYAICHRLWSGKQTRVDLATLAKICETLSCTPGDILKFEKGKRGSKPNRR
jgi:DNA-binding Xre family transcriptional regulator